MSEENITIIVNKKEITLPIKTIWYVLMSGNIAHIHVSDGNIYSSRMTMGELEALLGDDFIKVKRGCLVSVMAIHNITHRINLSNGETLGYVAQKKKEIQLKFQEKQERIIRSFNDENIPHSPEEYCDCYRVFDTMPIAFTDIEMVFDNSFRAVDWIFRYGNPALAKLENLPLEQIVGKSFSEIFPNMDVKWLQSYERATLYGETLKIVDYSPEINAYLDVTCFPTFRGHCGCILLDISSFKAFRQASSSERAMNAFFNQLLDGHRRLF